MHYRRRFLLTAAGVLALIGALAAVVLFRPGGDKRLARFVHSRPSVPVVFTSRSEPASLRAAANEGEAFVYPGQPLWQAREGRLRLLKPDGSVHELTWGRKLTDGTTLIDVMSPSVSPDGTRIIFAGRKAPPDHGHFRIYEMNTDGSDLRQVTGGPDDDGCIAAPPMRFRTSRELIPDDERKRVDFDDIDPIHLNFPDGRIAFISTRDPDLGRGHARRASTLWVQNSNGERRQWTANRNNDRWPVLLQSNLILFSLWSRNLEVVAADRSDIHPAAPGTTSATPPTDAWLGAFMQNTGGQFGGLVKPTFPVWRPRPLFNGRIVVMTSCSQGVRAPGLGEFDGFCLAQVEPGFVINSPSSLGAVAHAIDQHSYVWFGPLTYRNSSTQLTETLLPATPSACPENRVIFAASPLRPSAAVNPGSFGLFHCSDDWSALGRPETSVEIERLFDDPKLADSEPVAVYDRGIKTFERSTAISGEERALIKLANGTTYDGPAGTIFGSALFAEQHRNAPGQVAGDKLVFEAPPEEIDHIRVYASYRDRFDDPVRNRVAGGWELLAKSPLATRDTFGVTLPAGIPTVLAAFNKDGRVVRWPARHAGKSRSEWFHAFAGDHYSAVQPGGRHFCTGCHTGHSNIGPDQHRHQEVWRR
jgi:hypothetical protein